MSELRDSFLAIFFGIFRSKFSEEIRGKHYKDTLISCMVQFFVFLASAILTSSRTMVIIMFVYLLITILFFIYDRNSSKSVNFKATFYFTLYIILFIPIMIFYTGPGSLVSNFILIFTYFTVAFLLDFVPTVVLFILLTGATLVVSYFNDSFAKIGIIESNPTEASIVVFTVCAYFVLVLTLGSLVRKTIYYYNNEHKTANEALDVYHSALYLSEESGAYNERFLITELSNLAAKVKLGQLSNFSVASLSIDDIEIFEALRDDEKEKTTKVFNRKINEILEEGDTLVKLGDNDYAIIFASDSLLPTSMKLTQIKKNIGLTMFEYFPYTKVTLSMGIAYYSDCKTASDTFETAQAKRAEAIALGGNTIEG